MVYILITPVKNEEINLPNLAKCIIRQTCIPTIWVIVDDNSQDQTPYIIKDLKKKYDWIYSIKKNTNENGHLSFATSVKIGYEYAKEIIKKNNLCYDYIGKIDADILLPDNYFQRIIDEFKKDLNYGIISGSIIHITNIDEIENAKEIRGEYILDEFADERLYRKKFLECVGGFPVTYSPDTVLLIKAKLKGWKVKMIYDLHFHEVRKFTKKENWRRARNMGYSRYFLDYHPFLVILNALHVMTEKPYYNTIPYCYGYILGIIKGDRKIEDDDIKYYFRHKRWEEIKEKIKLIIKERLVYLL